MKRTITVFASIILAILALFQIGKYSFISDNSRFEIIVSLIAIIFLFLGIYLSGSKKQPSNLSTPQIDFHKLKELQISNREYEVLEKIEKGLSNKEIAEQLFLSESTIKTHVSNLLFKLNAKRRTQVVQNAKELQIL